MPRQTRSRPRQQDQDLDTPVDPRMIETPSAARRDSRFSTDSMEDESFISQQDREPSRRSYAADGDNSSNHENEDDVFSDRSARSSSGSMSPEADQDKARSPGISDIQQFEGEVDYVPAVKGIPRPPFRSASATKGVQTSSPPPSVSGGTPRSGRRSAIPTVSRIGSPNLSTQYSPKKTPPRFKSSTPPLVLLHVTLLPLRWAWGDILNNARPSALSDEAKTLRESWRQLQDRNGDTIQDRGVLLPHPQNDFELLEERLLEALELPLKRRARILACGHYLGPSNIMSFDEDVDSGDDDHYDDDKSRRGSVDKQTHYCATCASDIRYDALGPGKVYRVNVYASNGLLKAGAWEACWKEMERVDVELEPMIEPKVQEELSRLAAGLDPEPEDEKTDDRARAQDKDAYGHHSPDEDAHEGASFQEEHLGEGSFMGHQDNTMGSSPQQDPYSGHHRMNEERWQGMYRNPHSSTGFVPEGSFPAFKNATFLGMVQEAFQSLVKDKRNLMILLLSFVTILVAVRNGVGSDSGNKLGFLQRFGRQAASPHIGAGHGEGDGASDAVTTSTSTVLEVRYTPIGMRLQDDPCAAVHPQTAIGEGANPSGEENEDADDMIFGDDDDEDDDEEEGEWDEEDTDKEL